MSKVTKVAKKEEQTFFLEFIEQYKASPALWDTRSKDYGDRKIKNKQYAQLLTKYLQWDPDASLLDMKRKINTLRTNYRRVHRRLENLKKNGQISKDNNDSPLYYYKAMFFLGDCESTKQIILPKSKTSHGSEELKQNKHEQPPKRHKKFDGLEELKLISLVKKELSKPYDDFNRLGETWASKMRQMDYTQQLWAEKYINEILLEGQLGTLDRHSVQILKCEYINGD